jgi:hypothetical protein
MAACGVQTALCFLPTYIIIDVGALTLLAIIIFLIVRNVRSGALDLPFKQIGSLMQRRGRAITNSYALRSLGNIILLDVGTTRPLMTCHKGKWASHVLTFWGFVFLIIATTLAYLIKPEGAILPLSSSIKIFGNIGGIMVIVGCIGIFFVRYQQSGSPWHLNRSDLFLIFLLLATISGFTIELIIYSFGRSSLITAATYWTHLAFVVLLLATAPITKFAHAIYKPSWLLYDRLERKAVQE